MRGIEGSAVFPLIVCLGALSCGNREEDETARISAPWHCYRHGSAALCVPTARGCALARARTERRPAISGLTDDEVRPEPTPCMPEKQAYCFTMAKRGAASKDAVCAPDPKTCAVSAAQTRLLAPIEYTLTECQAYTGWQPEWGDPPE